MVRDLLVGITDIEGGRPGAYEAEPRRARELALREMAEEQRAAARPVFRGAAIQSNQYPRSRARGVDAYPAWGLEGKMQQTIKTSELSAEEGCRLGQAIYDRGLKSRLEPTHNGEFVAINVANGDYFVDPDEHRALEAAETKYPGAVFFMARIGSPAAHRVGSGHQR